MSRIALIEPFLGGSHQKWAQGLATHSRHSIDIFGLPDRFWKWRMHGGAITLAQKIIDSQKEYDIFLSSDFLDLALFKSLVAVHYPQALFFLYFHENQINYPWSPTDPDSTLRRDRHYGFINYTSALVADRVFFNSVFHLESFVGALPSFLKAFPDEQNLETIQKIKNKSKALPLAINLPQLRTSLPKIPNAILWNHRWEYDKNPKAFFQILQNIQSKGIDFKLIILGEHTQKYPSIFDQAQQTFRKEIIHFGYAESSEDYWTWLQKAAVIPVTSNQDFFGISIVEAMHADVYPILPDRLAYPEHIPFLEQKIHLYHTDMELEQKLTAFLLNKPTEKPFSTWVKHYAWTTAIKQYDRLLEK